MDTFIIQYNCRFRYLVVIIHGIVYVHKYENYKFDPPFLSFQAKKIFFVKSKFYPMTEISGAGDKFGFDGCTLLLKCEDN